MILYNLRQPIVIQGDDGKEWPTQVVFASNSTNVMVDMPGVSGGVVPTVVPGLTELTVVELRTAEGRRVAVGLEDGVDVIVNRDLLLSQQQV